MCGIWAIFGSNENVLTQCNAANKIMHRGPDCFRMENFSKLQNSCLAFHRLVIVDDTKGMQPLRLYTHPHTWLVYNGEIYNHSELSKEHELQLSTDVDGEPMIHLYQRVGAIEMAKLLDGVFAFIIVDLANRVVILGRDTYGVKPLFRYVSPEGTLAVCSEAKGLLGLCDGLSDGQLTQFPPGHLEIYDLDSNGYAFLKERTCFNKVGQFPAYKTSITSYDQDVKVNIANLVEASVEKRLMTDRRIGCLLSGGLDSSLIAALLVKLNKKKQLPYMIQTFSIGMEGSPDLVAARKVADYLGTEHHEIIMTPEEGLHAIPDVIYHLENYDVITIRSSIAMYLLSKYIKKNTDTTVILSGEGADELAQGYIFFHNAPSALEADKESRRLLEDLYIYDVLRCDRSTAAWSLELRIPFLDHQFTSYYLSLDPKMRQPHDGCEKYLLRSSFAESDLLPSEILWRPKEGFSDGISSIKKSWFEILQEYCKTQINNKRFSKAKELYPCNTPKTAEAFYYREIFEKNFPNKAEWVPYQWMPVWSNSDDPSARTLNNYKK